MKVSPITVEQAQIVKEWRNDCRETLRTGWTTQKQQEQFVDGNMVGDYMYWWFEGMNIRQTASEITAAKQNKPFNCAAGGLVNINRRVRNAEIALIVSPLARGMGIGTKCVDWILNEGFNNQNLKTIYGEVYECGATKFWSKMIKRNNAWHALLPKRQFWHGMYYDSIYFSIDEADHE